MAACTPSGVKLRPICNPEMFRTKVGSAVTVPTMRTDKTGFSAGAEPEGFGDWAEREEKRKNQPKMAANCTVKRALFLTAE